jgi:hypothetical protein
MSSNAAIPECPEPPDHVPGPIAVSPTAANPSTLICQGFPIAGVRRRLIAPNSPTDWDHPASGLVD